LQREIAVQVTGILQDGHIVFYDGSRRIGEMVMDPDRIQLETGYQLSQNKIYSVVSKPTRDPFQQGYVDSCDLGWC